MKINITALGAFLAFVIIMALPASSRAQEPMPDRGKGGMSQREVRPRIGGRIMSIDKEKHSLVLESRRLGEVTVSLGDQTKFSKDGEPIKLSDLKEGDFVQVGGEVNEDKKTVKAAEVAVRTIRPGGMRSPNR